MFEPASVRDKLLVMLVAFTPSIYTFMLFSLNLVEVFKYLSEISNPTVTVLLFLSCATVILSIFGFNTSAFPNVNVCCLLLFLLLSSIVFAAITKLTFPLHS